MASDTTSPARLDGAPVRFLFHTSAPDARCHSCGAPFARMAGTAPAFAYQPLAYQCGDDFAPVNEPVRHRRLVPRPATLRHRGTAPDDASRIEGYDSDLSCPPHAARLPVASLRRVLTMAGINARHHRNPQHAHRDSCSTCRDWLAEALRVDRELDAEERLRRQRRRVAFRITPEKTCTGLVTSSAIQ